MEHIFSKDTKNTKIELISEELIKKTALETIDIEQKALNQLKSSINQQFIKSIHAIYHMPGRLILTGIGKSAIIARKIVATLNSTGTPALFMHAADAIHGDLGMIRSGDITLCISKSGETPEIKVLVPLLKSRNIPLIAMVANENAYLATHADFVLLTPVPKEADPNNLAPTTSTTLQMALGDAIATSLLALRGFTSSDFAQFHPGGSLGKQLYLRVADIYVNNEKPMVLPEDAIHTAILEMTSRRLGATAVVNQHQELLGIITDGDLRRMLEKKIDMNSLCAKDIMTTRPKSIKPEAMAAQALEVMEEYNITQLIVSKDGLYLGIIHLHDLIKEGLL